MGNSNSNGSANNARGPHLRTRSFRRGSSVCRELEPFIYPTGLYPTCPWDTRAAKRLILEKKIAPRISGRDAKTELFTDECPICFMYYPDGSLNTTACCKKPMCSECFLQLKPPKKTVCCPFCNHESLNVKYSMPAGFNLGALLAMAAVATSPDGSDSCDTPATPEVPVVAAAVASVEERERLEEDLRSQLHLTNEPIRTASMSLGSRASMSGLGEDVGFVSEPHYFFASASDAARLEEMMLMEAIRRSMRDLTVASKPGDDTEEGGDEAEDSDDTSDHDEGDYDTLRPSQIVLDSSGTLSNSMSDSTPQRPSANWNPFD